MGPINENKIKKWVQQPKTGPVIFPQTILWINRIEAETNSWDETKVRGISNAQKRKR